MRLVLFQPDIAQNVGASIRSAACFGAHVDIIGPCGFPLSSKEINRVAMDYRHWAPPALHDNWDEFSSSPSRKSGRLILLTTKAEKSSWDMKFRETDLLMMGRESAGAPQSIHDQADECIRISISPDVRSLNVSVAAAIVLSEARRQIGWPQADLKKNTYSPERTP